MKNNIAKSNLNIDLSTKSDSFTSYLIGHIPTMDKKTYEEMVEIIKDAKNHIAISDAYTSQVLSRLNELKHSKGRCLRYLGDIILKGSKLGVV